MKRNTPRREFLRQISVGSATLGLSGLAQGATSNVSGTAATDSPHALSSKEAEEELRRRAAHFLGQSHLLVDYYRIRRRLAYPLPVSSLSIPMITVPSIGNYPWATWMTWELEERVYSLGWAAEWSGDEEARDAAERDLAALATWPKYGQYGAPDLSSGHAGRILWTALVRWSWPSQALRASVQAACQRLVEEALPGSEKKHGAFTSKADLLQRDEPHRYLHNIPLIGTIVAAMAATAIGHPKTPRLNQRVGAIFGAILDLRNERFTEGVSYDGYVLDFIADWLRTLSAEERTPILDHPRLSDYLDESYMLTAPGSAVQVAELSDVEAKEMPFHLSAQAKLHTFQPLPLRAWHLSRCPAQWLRTDALATLRPIADGLQGKAPAAGNLNAHYAAVLRSGWQSNDLAVAISCHASPMNHLQVDNGTLVIGTQGRWLIADPGYQQYVKGEEREFTLGPAAHNSPVINGRAQSRKAGRLAALDRQGGDVYRAAVDMTACYGDELDAESVVRTVWLAGNQLVIVADEIKVGALESVAYHWHGHPEAAWGCEEGWMLLYLDGSRLWLRSPRCPATDADIHRLPGSRGQLTLLCAAKPAVAVVWWAFALTDTPPRLTLNGDARRLDLADRAFSL